MSRELPLGRKEDFHLEFKAREALKDPEKIAREVVAFLNAEGGEVWVGLREENGRAVAVEPIADPDRDARRLLDYLIETVEPSPATEIRVEVIEAEGEGPVLQVAVRPEQGRGPYAFLRKGGRHFVKRIADRIRPMSREEVFGAKDDRDQSSPLRNTVERARAERNRRQEQEKAGLWLRLEPAEPIEIDLQDPRVETLLSEPESSGNRREGWTFSRFQFRPEVRRDHLSTAPEELLSVEIHRQGRITFSAPLPVLQERGEPREIWPPVLSELVVSALRVAAEVYRGVFSPEAAIVVDVALIGVKGWRLRPGTPVSLTRFRLIPPAQFEDDDFLLDRPLVVPAGDLLDNPDSIGYRLIERVYEAFGLRREQIPQVFDPVTRRLVLPS